MLVISSLGGGGAEGVCVNLANRLMERGWQVTLVVLHLNNAVRQKDLSPDVRLVVLGRNHARTAIVALWRLLRQYKSDRILVFNHQIAVLLVLLRALGGFDFKIVARNISTLSQKKALETSFWHKYVVQALTKIFYGKVDHVIAQSKGMADDLVAFYGVQKEKIVTVHNPVDSSIEDYSESNQKNMKDYLLCAGRLESVKAFHYAINAFAAVAPCYPSLRLKIVGKGRLEGELKMQAEALGVGDRVDLEGYQTRMIPYYLGAKATLLTSLYEGFPNVLVESIALGTPVVSFDCPSGPSEIVVDGVNGFLVAHKDENQLADAIRKAMEADWNRDLVRVTAEQFSSDIILKQYEKVLG
ncbi:glycosyltransferase [Natronospirillum operosum]|uniref:Glycosyltransferase n=2 Tax=Natronospirillum operosum TaxID=2759953 RepID=A0A4Z0WDZ1_9GAMM|nr:glycosyltransferase [Natronospirillum operosum]